jgi:S-adenosylmethionine synthetase
MRPKAIDERLKLRNPIYEETASYGHVGRTPIEVTKTFKDGNGNEFTRDVELFTWEKTDKVDEIKAEFGL